ADTVAGLANVPDDLRSFVSDSKVLHNRLMSFIIKRCEKFDEQRAVRTYRPLLELSKLEPLWLFTTNYDRIIEYCCEMSDIQFSDGFALQSEDLYLWKDLFDDQLKIAKIHGSINWFRDENSPDTIIKLEEPHPFPTSEFRIRYKEYNFSTSIIIPTFEKYISELPFLSLQTRLIDAIRRAKICFVIGTRLHDSHIKNLLLTNLDNTVIVSIGHYPEIVKSKLGNHNNVVTLNAGFEEFAIASSGYLEDLLRKISNGNVLQSVTYFVEKVRETLTNLRQPTEGGPIEELITKLKSTSYVERANSARRLGESGVKRAIPQLLTLLEDQSEYVRIQAVSALGLLQADEALPKFREMLMSDNSEDVKVEIILSLKESGSQNAKAILTEINSFEEFPEYLKNVARSS
ncbi:MAG: HEAT repeat domain-containing protein, partial [Nitrososphaerales archaeon]